MKFNKQSSALILLVLIAFNILVANSEQIKSLKRGNKRLTYKRRTDKATRSHSESKVTLEIMDKIKEILADPLSIFRFIFGIISEFINSAKEIYQELKNRINIFRSCFDKSKSSLVDPKDLVDINKELDEVKSGVNDLKKTNEFKDVEDKLSQKSSKKAYCVETQKEIQLNYMRAADEEHQKKQKGIFHLVNVVLNSYVVDAFEQSKKDNNDIFCRKPIDPQNTPKTAEIIRQNFSSYQQYYKECNYFRNFDCAVFDPETSGVWDFVKKAYNFLGMVKHTGTCLVNFVTNFEHQPHTEYHPQPHSRNHTHPHTPNKIDNTLNKIDNTANKINNTVNKIDNTVNKFDNTVNKIDNGVSKGETLVGSDHELSKNIHGFAQDIHGETNQVKNLAHGVSGQHSETKDFPAPQDLGIMKKVAKLFAGDFLAAGASAVLGVVANVLTLGIWGGIKGAYYLVKLGIQIKEFYDEMNKKDADLAFMAGSIIGRGILIAKSLLFGRRRRIKRK